MTVRPDVLVVLPTYNEAVNLEPIAAAIRSQGVRLLVVDDASPDGTGLLADRLAGADPEIAVLHREMKQGLGPAYAAGFAHGLADGASILLEMDADFSHDPADILRLVAAVDAGADLAIGSRYVPGGKVEDWPWYRRWLSSGGNWYARTMLGTEIGDMTAGFRAFRANALRTLRADDCRASGYGFQIEMAWKAARAGMQITEVPITFRDRRWGESKMNGRIALEAIGLVTKWGLLRAAGRLPSNAGEAA